MLILSEPVEEAIRRSCPAPSREGRRDVRVTFPRTLLRMIPVEE